MVAATSKGLDKLVPTKTGWLEAQVGAGSTISPFARLEAGLRIIDGVGAFGWGEVDRSGWRAGAGARLVF